MNTESKFDEITAAVTSNEKYVTLVHDVCHVPKVTNLKDFLKIYEEEERAFDQKYDDLPKVTPTVEMFAEAFKKIEEYPANLQKLKKPMRERLNSNISRSSPTLNDSTSHTATKENSTSLLNLNRFDDVPTATETLSNFVKFQKQLKEINAEMSQQTVEEEYVYKLKQLNTFAQQLEKLLPSEKIGKSALTSEEENILEDLVNRMDDLNFIRKHRDVFRQQNSTINNIAPKLDKLVDILSYCLLAVNTFNIN